MTQFSFGSGTLIMKRTDVANTPPALLGTLQDITVTFDRKLESLLGQYNVADALAGGEMKISGSAKFARLQATQIGNLFFGQNPTPNALLEMSTGETVTSSSSGGPASGNGFTVANGSGYVEDLGVFYSSTGVQLTPVTSSPTVGQYIAGVAGTGAYSTNASDNSAGLLCYYSYTTTGGNKLIMSKQLMGPVPIFSLNMKESFTYFGVAKDLVIKLNACASSKMSLPFNNQKFTIAEMDFQAQSDAAGNWGTIALSE